MDDIEQRDRAGHFILADQCGFFLHHRVGRWRVSTVGEKRASEPRHAKNAEGWDVMQGGYGEPCWFYETMVFPEDDAGEVERWQGVARDLYKTRAEAEAGHAAMIARFAAGPAVAHAAARAERLRALAAEVDAIERDWLDWSLQCVASGLREAADQSLAQAHPAIVSE